MIREVFPTLPEWHGDEPTHRWLGEAFAWRAVAPGRCRRIATRRIESNGRIRLIGLAPAPLVDRWFPAFARATQPFPAEARSTISFESAEIGIVTPSAAATMAPSPQTRSLTLVEILTVGLPFCVFKVACAVPLLGTGRMAWLGWLLVAWGVVDTLLNLINAFTVGALGRRGVSVCLLQALTRAVRPTARSANVGTALDMMLSFVLVAAMIGTGALGLLSPSWLWAWNIAVVFNVLGAGALRLADALRE